MRAVCLPDTLAKVRMLLAIEKGFGRAEDEILASIVADLEKLAPTVSPALAALIDRWHAIEADHERISPRPLTAPPAPTLRRGRRRRR
jgi:hypothetical protein